MATDQFEAKVRREASVAIIDLHGEVNGSADPALDAAYEEAVSDGAKSLLLNFERTTYINSTGIALIVGLLARSRKEGRKVSAFGLVEHYREIFEITRVADFMTIFPDEASAISDASVSRS
jgi:anti-anti-sigma factor